MVSRRKPKQKSGYLGRRHFGAGDVKNRRGSGNRGGRGNAGMCKHKGTWAAKYAPGYFGKHGFVNPTKRSVPVSHLYEINQKAVTGRLERREGRFYYEFEGKILATGMVSVPLMIRASSWSRKVEEKLKQSGGAIEKMESPAPQKK